MNKGFKVLSSVLAMSMVLASGVFAEEAKVWDAESLKVIKGYLDDNRAVVTKKVEVSSVYEELVNDAFKKDLGKYDEALKSLKNDVEVVEKLGTARCEAQFELDSANNELLAGRRLLDLAKGIGSVALDKVGGKDVNMKNLVGVELEDLTLPNLFGKNLLKADLDKLTKLKKANMDLVKSYNDATEELVKANADLATEAFYKKDNKNTEAFAKLFNKYVAKKAAENIAAGDNFVNDNLTKLKAAVETALQEAKKAWKDGKSDQYANLGLGLNGDSNGDKLTANVKALNDLYATVSKKGYTDAVLKLTDYYKDEQQATLTQGKIDLAAKIAAGKIHLIERFAKEHGFTLRACTLADYTAKVSDKAAKAEDKNKAKKDDVPNTASYFTIYVPTCELSAPAVKYYGAAQVYEKVLRRPLVCKKVKEEIVKVPMFTFDELTAYDVACCCCK